MGMEDARSLVLTVLRQCRDERDLSFDLGWAAGHLDVLTPTTVAMLSEFSYDVRPWHDYFDGWYLRKLLELEHVYDSSPCEGEFFAEEGTYEFVRKAFVARKASVHLSSMPRRGILFKEISEDLFCVQSTLPRAIAPHIVEHSVHQMFNVSIDIPRLSIHVFLPGDMLTFSYANEPSFVEYCAHIPSPIDPTDVTIYTFDFADQDTFAAFTMLFTMSARYTSHRIGQ